MRLAPVDVGAAREAGGVEHVRGLELSVVFGAGGRGRGVSAFFSTSSSTSHSDLFSRSHLLKLLLDERAVLEASLRGLPRGALGGEELADEPADPSRAPEEQEARGLFRFHFFLL